MELMKDTDRFGQLLFQVLSLPGSFRSVAHLPLSGSLDSPYDLTSFVPTRFIC